MVFSIDVPTKLEVRGDVADNYGAVADAVRRNMRHRGEVGAACAVVRDDELVVDLWGGYRDGHRRLPWTADTMVTRFLHDRLHAVGLARARQRPPRRDWRT